jgi:ferrous iron transport protein B
VSEDSGSCHGAGGPGELPEGPPNSPRAGTPRVIVAGNPNAGKSTLFNALTGGSAQVGNFSGTTVSSLTGRASLPGLGPVELVDVPGTFSLAAASPDERVAIDALLGLGRYPRPDAVMVVIDGPRLLRSLYLVLQILELGLPAVLAVNLMDEARSDGLELRLEAVSAALGVPVVGTVARSREGLDSLRGALAEVLRQRPVPRPAHGWSAALDADVARVRQALPPGLCQDKLDQRLDALARWVLLSADADGRLPGPGGEPSMEAAARLAAVVVEVRRAALEAGRDLEAELVQTRYTWIEARDAQFIGRELQVRVSPSDQIDRVLLHPVAGPLVFVGVMGLAFAALFSWADPIMGLVEGAMGAVGGLVASGMDALVAASPSLSSPLTVLRDLLVDGVIGGVGGVVVFLPQVALLFLFLAIIEDCGYLARAAHLADRVLRAAGLPGRAFVPVLSGYACAVPAILATRTMPRFRDRLLTMLVIPLTSCSARLPVYTLLIAALFPTTVMGWLPVQPLVLAGMYLFSTALAVSASVLIGNLVLTDRQEAVLLELPPYRVPDPAVVLRVVWARCTDFLREAGGIILMASIAIWALLYFPRYEPEDLLPPAEIASIEARGEDPAEVAAPLALERSFGGRLGHLIEPAIEPLGYDWRIGIGLLGAFAAREVFVATMGVVYGIGDEVDEESEPLREKLRTDTRSDGSLTYTPLVGVSLMVFFAIALQCLSTLAVLRKESGGWWWPAVAFGWTLGLAWGSAFLIYQGGRLLGLQ